MMEDWNNGRMKEWSDMKTGDILFSGYCLFPIFQYSILPGF
jgi:hypothetical protein